jgi:23S rRNA (uracil1939-C5)-methyltransferase
MPRQPPRLAIGGIDIAPPPGAFLQATSEAESVMQADIARFAADTGLAPSARILDLYAGCGTLGLPLLASGAQVLAAESDADALAALKAGVDAAGYGAQLTIRQTDLANAPLTGETLPPAGLAIIDPPRSGAAAQIAALVDAPAAPQRIAMVSLQSGQLCPRCCFAGCWRLCL